MQSPDRIKLFNFQTCHFVVVLSLSHIIKWCQWFIYPQCS